MENCTKFNDLEAHLRELFKSASYSESTVKDMDFILRAFTNYMNANGMEEYSPEIGEILIHYCRETLKVCDSRVSRAKVIVGKLNRLYQGLDGEEALWADKIVPVELPDSLSRALDSFISHCRHKGNKETTLHYKRWICSRFLKNLEMLGCQSLQSINGELIQSAFLQLGYLRYWERIGPFLRYLFESGQIQRDFSKRHGSRAFRSSIASNMVNDKVSTEVVRKVLGHGTKHAIRHYVRMDIENMRLCPLPAPKPSGIFSEMLSWKEDDRLV